MDKKIRVIDAKTSLWIVTLPIFIEMLLHMLVGNIDQLMVSRFSDNGVAAIGNVNQIINLVFILLSVLGTSATIMISQVLGAKDYGRVSEIYSVAVYVNLAFGLVLSTVLVVFARPILRLLQTPAELFEDAVIYLMLVGSGIFCQAVIVTLGVIFRANGHTKHTMYVSVAVNLINIAGNALLLYGWCGLPRMGVAGVGIATLVSRIIGMLLLLVLFKRTITGSISVKYLRPFPFATLIKLLRIGIPAGGESLIYSLAQTLLLGFANTMGAVVLSARAYASIIAWFSWLYAAAVSQGTQIIVGHLIGAGDEDGADRRVRRTLWPAVFVSLGVTVLIYFSGGALLGVFTDNPEIIAIGRQVLLVEIVLELGRAFNMIIIRSLQAAGDVRFPVAVGVMTMWGVMVPVGYLLGVHLGLGLMGLWIGVACDECLRAGIMFLRWKRGHWRGRAVAKAGIATG